MICNDSYMIANLANRIKKIREDAGDNPNIAAKKVGISRPAYVKWEAGDTENMKLKNLTSFCDKYHVDVVDLLGGNDSGAEKIKAMQPTARYSSDPETAWIVDAYCSLPTDKRKGVHLAILNALMEAKLENPMFDTGDIGQVFNFNR